MYVLQMGAEMSLSKQLYCIIHSFLPWMVEGVCAWLNSSFFGSQHFLDSINHDGEILLVEVMYVYHVLKSYLLW